MEKSLAEEYPDNLNFLCWRITWAGGVSSYLFQSTVKHYESEGTGK